MIDAWVELECQLMKVRRQPASSNRDGRRFDRCTLPLEPLMHSTDTIRA